MSRFLWLDTFKDGKSVVQAPPDILKEETAVAWDSTVTGESTRFFPVVSEDDSDSLPRGAVVHLAGFKDYDAALAYGRTIPWAKHNFADWEIFPFQNFISVQKLFHQNGKYRDAPAVKRPRPFSSNPVITWYATVSAKRPDTYDQDFGLGDALACYRLLKGGICDEVFDILEPKQGKILRIKANTKEEVEGFLSEIESVQKEGVDVTLVRTKTVSAWDFIYF